MVPRFRKSTQDLLFESARARYSISRQFEREGRQKELLPWSTSILTFSNLSKLSLVVWILTHALIFSFSSPGSRVQLSNLPICTRTNAQLDLHHNFGAICVLAAFFSNTPHVYWAVSTRPRPPGLNSDSSAMPSVP